MTFKTGQKVVMNDKYYVSEENQGRVWTTRSEPWDCCSQEIILLEGMAGGYATDGLTLVNDTGEIDAED